MIFGARLSLGSRVDMDKPEEGKGEMRCNPGISCAACLLYP